MTDIIKVMYIHVSFLLPVNKFSYTSIIIECRIKVYVRQSRNLDARDPYVSTSVSQVVHTAVHGIRSATSVQWRRGLCSAYRLAYSHHPAVAAKSDWQYSFLLHDDSNNIKCLHRCAISGDSVS